MRAVRFALRHRPADGAFVPVVPTRPSEQLNDGNSVFVTGGYSGRFVSVDRDVEIDLDAVIASCEAAIGG